MKAFIVLACLAVASSEPLSYLANGLVNPLLHPYAAVNPLLHPYGVHPFAHAAKDVAQQNLMKQQLADQSAQLAAQIAGDKPAEVAAYARQTFTQNIQKQAVEGKLPFVSVIAKREAESEAYTPAQAAALFGVHPYGYFGGYYGLRTPLVGGYRLLKREAEATHHVVAPYTNILGYNSPMYNNLLHPYTSALHPYAAALHPYNAQVATSAVVNSENAQVYKANLINPFTGQQTNYANDRAIDAPEYAGRGKTISVNAGAVHISKREADPAVLVRPYASAVGYPYGLRTVGYPYYGLGYRTLGYY